MKMTQIHIFVKVNYTIHLRILRLNVEYRKVEDTLRTKNYFRSRWILVEKEIHLRFTNICFLSEEYYLKCDVYIKKKVYQTFISIYNK